MTLPLQNIRVLDFGQYIAGPATAVILADQGAEVIRIDPPGGPRWDSPAMDTLNRRKGLFITPWPLKTALNDIIPCEKVKSSVEKWLVSL